MKKLLPQSYGFTLVELLVIITIIAILSAIGFVAYNGLAGRGNNSRRAADIKAFADAMEVVRERASANVYSAPAATDFAAGIFPTEPINRTEQYCYKDGTAVIANPVAADWNSAACPTGWANVNGVGPTVGANATYFKFCTVNEAKLAVICQGNRQ